MMGRVFPVLSVVATILAIWTLAVVPMNAHLAADMAARADIDVVPSEPGARQDMTGLALAIKNPTAAVMTYTLDRPRLPSPHQVAAEMYDTIFTLGILLAVGIVYNRTMDKSVMPWAITSQTIPILALAPMIIVMLGAIGIQGLLPKSVISAYLSFFPVVVGMVKGLRAPDSMQLDLLRTYSASSNQGFWKLRLPASMPYLFASLKIGISAALVGAIVGELPTGARAGFGARMLVGDQYGQPMVTWAALFGAAITAAALVAFLTFVERRTLRRMGMV